MIYIYPKTKPYISIPVGVDAHLKSTSIITDKDNPYRFPSLKQSRRQRYIDSLNKPQGKKRNG